MSKYLINSQLIFLSHYLPEIEVFTLFCCIITKNLIAYSTYHID